ncbi:hypothetical protein [Chryseobacterium daeguense]|uniref:hypothetical protein n=1 Tax=Chryseobacterium daeguense TaxID=412438 RepID=UPI0003FD4CD1|nr:hypothetical protein [Chryseobacterium daeguense]
MSLIDKTYFEQWNLIPNVNEPDPNNRTSEDLDATIMQVEKDVLSLAFGWSMWEDFKQYINTDGGIDDSAPQNYKDIVNGKSYLKAINGDDKECHWRGLLETNPKSSLLADFVYYTYKVNNATLTTEFGEAAVEGKVGNKASITPKVTQAYNRFVTKFNGGIKAFPSGYTMDGRPYWYINGGVDYYGVWDTYGEVSLMRFLLDNKSAYPLLDTDIRRFGMPIKNEFGL